MNVNVNLSAAANQFNTSIPSAAAKAKESGAFLNVGDKTQRVGNNDMGTFTQRLADAFRTENADVIRALDGLSAEDKAEIAARSYLQMQGRVMSAITKEESDIKKFGALKDEKAYYTRMLEDARNNGGAYIEDAQHARYDFADMKAGDKISEKELEKALDGVQERIDNFLYPYGRNEDGTGMSSFMNEKMTVDYIAYASAFKEVTGLDGECLDPGDSLLLSKPDRNEDNFLDKARENIDSLNTMSKDLKDLMKRFRDEQETEIGGGKLSEEARARMEAFDYIREQFTYGGTSGELKTLGILNVEA